MTSAYDRGLRDGMSKIAVDPVTAAAGAFATKQLLGNAISRHIMKVPGARRVAQEIAGVGLRVGAAGKPMPHRAAREALALVGSPDAVSLFEHAHRVGREAGTGVTSLASHPALARLGSGEVQRFIAGVPTDSRGLRRAADYMFTPVSEAVTDARNAVRRATGKPIIPHAVMGSQA